MFLEYTVFVLVVPVLIVLYLKFTRHHRYLKKYPGPKTKFFVGNAFDFQTSSGKKIWKNWNLKKINYI